MATTLTTPASAATPAKEPPTLTKTQKLAALLVMLGPEAAAHVLKGFSPHDVDAVCTEMAKLEIVPHELQKRILEEFSAVAVEAGTCARGGVEFTRTTLERAMGQFKANEV